jgi:hypothetical protein
LSRKIGICGAISAITVYGVVSMPIGEKYDHPFIPEGCWRCRKTLAVLRMLQHEKDLENGGPREDVS